MKLNYLLLTGIAVAALTRSLLAAETIRYEAATTGSEMKLDGKATGKTWHCIGKIIGGSFEVEPAWQKDPSLKSVTCLGKGKTPPKCELFIPIRSLKSQAIAGASTMDKRMQLEMKADKFARIEYRLTELAIKGEVPASGSPVTFDATGELAISGVTNKVSFPITMERVGADTLKWTGKYETKMTAFGIKPPEFKLLGIGLETADEVTLAWTWMMGVKAPEAK
ncbi:MAG: YceI family protein [Verrucomicrobia bacterium]|nr:YceI family protein [Verrucomicrobiota bacterium]